MLTARFAAFLLEPKRDLDRLQDLATALQLLAAAKRANGLAAAKQWQLWPTSTTRRGQARTHRGDDLGEKEMPIRAIREDLAAARRFKTGSSPPTRWRTAAPPQPCVPGAPDGRVWEHVIEQRRAMRRGNPTIRAGALGLRPRKTGKRSSGQNREKWRRNGREGHVRACEGYAPCRPHRRHSLSLFPSSLRSHVMSA